MKASGSRPLRFRRPSSPGAAPTRGAGPTVTFLFLSISLLVLSRLDHRYVTGLRWQVAEMMSPLLHAAMVPLEPVRDAARTVGQAFTLGSELERLQAENQHLKDLEWRSQELLRKYNDLAAASNAARELELDFITARVVSISSGAFVRSAMINAGSKNGLKSSYPVISGDGLIGRVVDAGSNIARVLLITDGQSRIPVYVGPNSIRAVLAGDNGPRPRIVLPAPNRELAVGDEVYTSGIGGLFPRGLRIGKITEMGEKPVVEPYANLDDIDYLSVLFYDTPSPDRVDLDLKSKGSSTTAVDQTHQSSLVRQ